MDGLADEINGLFSDPQTSVLDTVLVRIGTLLRDDPERRADVEAALTDAHRNMHPDVQTHQSAFIALLALEEMRNVSKIVDTWTDLALRPILKDTRVEPGTLAKAKALIVAALVNLEDEQHAGDYRRRIMQLYLLDAPSETLVTDSLDMAELEDIERSKRVFFKDNLTEVLVDFALQRPQAFCHSFYRTFGFPQWRLELLVLLRTIVANDDFDFVAFLESELLTRILLSLTVDNSASVITVGVTVLVMSLPHFAVHAHEQLVKRLPSMLVILARVLGSSVLLWTSSSYDSQRRGVPTVEDAEDEPVGINGDALNPSQQIHWSGFPLLPESEWNRIELATVSHDWQSPNLSCASHLFTYLYGIFPSNTAGFIRQPLAYVERHEVPCPFMGEWRSVLNEKQLRARAMLRSRTLALSPWTLSHDIETELTDHSRMAPLKPFEIVDQIIALDIGRSAQRPSPPTHQVSGADSASIAASAHTGEPSIASTRSRISVREMITTTLALKSGVDVEVSDLPPHWPSELALFIADATTPSSSLPATEQQAQPQSVPSDSGEGLRAKALRAVGILQRELLLLRNELNYQLFLKRGLLQHVERLQHDRNAAVRRDVELQHLRDMRKEYKSQVDGLTKQLKAAQLSTTQLRNNLNSEAADCNAARKDLRTQRGRWLEETNVLRAAKEQVDAAFAAQSARISELDRQVFQLVTEKKENEHKVARLVQYEEQIEKQKQQLLLWDNDVARYIYQKTKIQEMSSNYQVLLERLKTYKGVNEQLAEENRKLQMRPLARIVEGGDRTPTRSAVQPDYSKLGAEIMQLRASDRQLRDQVRELEMELAAVREWPAQPQEQTIPLVVVEDAAI